MKNIVKNYINLLNTQKLKEFGLKNNIYLTDYELEYLLDLIKNNFEDILKDDKKYLEEIKNNINPLEYQKLKDLYLYYKNKYKKYLF